MQKEKFAMRFFSLILNVLLLTSLIDPALAKSIHVEKKVFTDGMDFEIQYSQQDLYVKYGEYTEIEFGVDINSEINFEVLGQMRPEGLNLSQLTYNSVLLSGAPEFIGEFCFILSAKNLQTLKQTAKKLCLFSEENELIKHPKFRTQRYLPTANTFTYNETLIEFTGVSGEEIPQLHVGDIPLGLEVYTDIEKFELLGRVSEKSISEFVVRVDYQMDDVDYSIFKQFLLEVNDTDTNEYQCGAGYYFDDLAGYCVPNSDRVCGIDEFYDYELDQCVPNVVPGNITCAPGFYYDHFTFRCVRNSYHRCPVNYDYSPYYNRCVRQTYTCQVGFRYDWATARCVRVAGNICGIGEYYSHYQRRCLPNFGICRLGDFWDGYRCLPRRRFCGEGQYYDRSVRRCIDRGVYRRCGPNSYYDTYRQRCVRRAISNRLCADGSRYSFRVMGCISFNRGWVARPFPYGPIFRPRPSRPNRPVVRPRPSRPNRPATRPNRPSRPTRPGVRPRPSRPNRPATRPNRPARPNRPGVRPRPSRPNRPATRPSRPARPNRPGVRPRPSRPNRPATRPSRPARPRRPAVNPRPARPRRPAVKPRPARRSRPARGPRR